MSKPPSFCEHCGAAFSPGARFCESCGKEPMAAGPPVADSTTCPRCGQADQSFTAKDFSAREISDAEEKAANDADKWGPTYAQIVLEEPEKPEPAGISFWLVVPFIPVLNFLACWFAPMHSISKLLMLAIVVFFWMCVLVPDLYNSGIYGLVGCFFILFYYVAIFLDRGRRARELLSRRIPAYEKAHSRWEHLHYCQRCEVAWIDNEPGNCVGIDATQEMMEK